MHIEVPEEGIDAAGIEVVLHASLHQRINEQHVGEGHRGCLGDHSPCDVCAAVIHGVISAIDQIGDREVSEIVSHEGQLVDLIVLLGQGYPAIQTRIPVIILSTIAGGTKENSEVEHVVL